MDKQSRIFVAGHRGLAGSAILRRLQVDGYSRLLTRTRSELDLRDRPLVDRFFEQEKPDVVFLAAGKVGGILANSTYPAQFIADNLAIELNVIDAAYRNGARKLVFLGSSCIYPKFAPQPIREESLLCGELEPTNEPYAVAKIAGIKLAQAYRAEYGFNAISLMPTNLYGPGDNFSAQRSHVLPALMRRFHEAKNAGSPEVVIWGTGTPRREFLHVNDLADAAVFLMDAWDRPEIVNVGSGQEVTIAELAELIAGVVDYRGRIRFDSSYPDGTPRKLLDIARIRELGWMPKIPLREGIRSTYEWYCSEVAAEMAAG